MATFHEPAPGDPWIFVKGAPERVLEMCRVQMGSDGAPQALDVNYWRRMVTDTAAKGLRLLARPASAQRRWAGN